MPDKLQVLEIYCRIRQKLQPLLTAITDLTEDIMALTLYGAQ